VGTPAFGRTADQSLRLADFASQPKPDIMRRKLLPDRIVFVMRHIAVGGVFLDAGLV